MRAVTDDRSRLPRALTIFLVSLAGLLLEVGYTRIVSFKLTVNSVTFQQSSSATFAALAAPVTVELIHRNADVEPVIKRRSLVKLTASLLLPDTPYAALRGR